MSLAVAVVALAGCDASDPAPLRVDSRGRPADGVRIRVEVLNAGGVRGAARVATDALREIGFDVVHYGNATLVGQDSSVVLDRVGDLGTALAVAEVLGIDNVRSEPDSNLYVETTVLLGSEWTDRRMEGREEPEPGASRWWDPRGWFGR